MHHSSDWRLIAAAALVLLLMAAGAVGGQQRAVGRGPGPGPGPAPGPGPGPAPTTAHFLVSSHCESCHDAIVTTSGAQLLQVDEWRRSMMRHAFVDPLWQAKVRSEMRRIPGLASFIEAKCVTCHAPMAWTEATKGGSPVKVFDDGFLDPDHPYHAIAMEGVGCTLCHQIQDTPELGTSEGSSGNFSIADADDPDGRWIYGQYQNPVARPMLGSTGYQAVYGAHIEESALCGSCHDLETDYVDAAGNIASTPSTRFPEQMPYTEWLYSDFGPAGSNTSCLECHMANAGTSKISRSPRWLGTRENVAHHPFRSENTTMLRILDTFAGELGVSGEDLDEALTDASEYLASGGSVQIVDAALEQSVLEVTVRVVNHTAHKMPTSLPSRRAYLHVIVRDAAGTIVFESGRLNADHTIAGVDADANPAAYEPHYDLITSQDQVQVYEAIMRNVEGGLTYTLLRASGFLKDNRLLPAGLDPATAPERIRPAGACLTDEDFTGGSDEVTYRIANLTGNRYSVVVELLDQPIAYPFIRDLQTDMDDVYVARFMRMWETVPATAEVIGETGIDVMKR